MGVKKNSYLKKKVQHFRSSLIPSMRSFRKVLRRQALSPFSPSFYPFIPWLLSEKFFDMLVFLSPTFFLFFALYQLNIECQLLFYQLLIRDKGQRERNLSHLVWNLVLKNKLFPKSTGAPRQVSNERRSLDLDALPWCSDGTRHVCIATSSPATRSPFSLSTL